MSLSKMCRTTLFFLLLSMFVWGYLTPDIAVAQYDNQSDVTAKVINLAKEFKFKVLSQKQFARNGLTINILVPTATTREKALNIARRIKGTFPGFFLAVSIFDSREAYQNRDNVRYPEKKYFRHYLVEVTQNPKTGFNEIQWMAKGRR